MNFVAGAQLVPFISGAAELEPGPHGGVIPHRLPAWARTQVHDDLFATAELCPTGVAITCSTASRAVTLTLAVRGFSAPAIETTGTSIVVRQNGTTTVIPIAGHNTTDAPACGERRPQTHAPTSVVISLTGAGPLEILLPHATHVEIISLKADTPLTTTHDSRPRWTHYGSSISHGTNAVDPSRTWPLQAAHALGWNLRNLAFSGNAQLDPFVARVIRDQQADIITLKVGINLVNADSMRERTFRPALHGFLDLIRDGQPHTPILVISAIACPIQEQTPGPIIATDVAVRTARREVESDSGALTLQRTRVIVEDVVSSLAENDPALGYHDGRELFDTADAHLLHDQLHPSQKGLDRIATRFIDSMRIRSLTGLAPRVKDPGLLHE